MSETTIENANTLPSVPPQSPEVEEPEEISRYQPEKDRLATVFALMTNVRYARTHPEVSIAARLLSRLKIVPVTNPNICPMMAVGIANYKHILMYNPEWLNNSSFLEITATVVHEAYHIMLRDIPRFLRRMALYPEDQRSDVHDVLNVALDAANNYLMQERMSHMKYGGTGHWVLPEQMKLIGNQSSEQYLEVLLDRARRQKPDLKGWCKAILADPNAPASSKAFANAAQKLADQNAHDWKGKSKTDPADPPPPPMSPEEMEAIASSMDEEAKNHTVSALKDHQRRQGNLPSHMQGILDAMLEEGVIPWTVFLRQLVAARVSSHRLRTTRKFHPHQFIYAEEAEDGSIQPLEHPFPVFPGVEVDKTFVIMWALDTSGSMNEADVQDGLSELQGLIRTDPNIHVIVVQCDTNISDVSILNPEEELDKYIKEVGRTSYGGTSFTQPFELAAYVQGRLDHVPVKSNMRPRVEALLRDYDNVDLMIYHTDGEASAPPAALEPVCPVLWCFPPGRYSVPGGSEDELFGTIIHR